MKTLYTNGEIWCSRGRYTEAVLVDDGVIAALGADALSASHDVMIDLAGRFLAPGFIDAHAHPLFAGRESQGPQLNGLTTIDAIVKEIER